MIKIKVKPEDFVVEEIANIQTEENGGYCVFLLEKRGWNTLDVLKRISNKLNILYSNLSYGSRKDKYALTSQYITIALQGDKQISPKYPLSSFKKRYSEKIGEENYSLTFVGLTDRPMGPDLIEGNKFCITIRNLTENDLKSALSRFEKESFEFLKKNQDEFVPVLQKISREEMVIFFSAYQSYLWNEVLRKIIQSLYNNTSKIYKGIAENNYIFYTHLDDAKKAYLNNLSIPLPASNIKMPDAFTENLYSEVLQENELKSPMFNIRKIRQAFFKGVERKTVVIPESLSIEHSDDEIYIGKKKLIMERYKVVVIALGGNALIREEQQGTIEEQFENISKSLDGIIYCLKKGYSVVITHGNGPQVGNMLLMAEASRVLIPEISLGICVADTEGAIGYTIQQSLTNRLRKEGINKCVVTVLTQVVVDKNDNAFSNPTKPIGPFFKKEDAERLQYEKGWHIAEDSHRGYRRVVASPEPIKIIEVNAIKSLLEAGAIVIAAGGGGIPVIEKENGDLEGVDVVIDKDLASSILARVIKADRLIMLTGVEHVCLNYRQSNEQVLTKLTVEKAKKYLHEGHFPPGSMGPKIQAAINYLNYGGELAIIASIDKVREAMEGVSGTKITMY